MLKTDFLPENTRRLFDRLKHNSLLDGFTLIGGSALALQIGHRISEDLDFTIFGKALPVDRLDLLIQTLQNEGRRVENRITDSDRTRFRINAGDRMENHIQDYVVDGAKLTFFSRTCPPRPKKQIEYLQTEKKIYPDAKERGFNILSMQGLFVMKSLVLADRSKSRDIFDLMVLTRDNHFSIDDVFRAIANYASIHEQDVEKYKSILTGLLPLGENDEGFESIGLDVRMDDIYQYFSDGINQYEIAIAKNIRSSMMAKAGDDSLANEDSNTCKKCNKNPCVCEEDPPGGTGFTM